MTAHEIPCRKSEKGPLQNEKILLLPRPPGGSAFFDMDLMLCYMALAISTGVPYNCTKCSISGAAWGRPGRREAYCGRH